MSLQRDITTGFLLKVDSGKLAKECCCCTRCMYSIGGVLTDIGCKCQYKVTFSGLTGVYAGYNGEHILNGSGCTWTGETLDIDDNLELYFAVEGSDDAILFLNINGLQYETAWSFFRNPPLPDCGIVGTYIWAFSNGGQSQSTATAIVSFV
jgi:hypothetical protein